ncbi:hypothetical protein CYMTET_40494 [Cymbomonas tetramitiformis]|uniref:Uncharacterized protein n=1 Tax=Cymbomonas tetramitiformis TaxID=36881 RepID=A0AAE0C7Y0_9CHLO|nr:hypothetical protein CYMTET_40494 [Cymbomonas tetramitiformis]
MAEAAKDDQKTSEKLSCVPYFDEAWFCYSPVYQLEKYYTEGVLDDCTSHLYKVFKCLQTKTKFAEEVVAPVLKKPAGFWTIRTPEEAAEHWKTATSMSTDVADQPNSQPEEK